ncbi:hypothetical protein PF010_g9532 [Phytophthora fragariae]|nr:hypothetical protein PF003_g8063 [Phytophthora fragariae]KAE8937236.1 hypothetical protein PF009_g12858 [Phytophthora fragariae]KAE9009103.1 hypothetical protein PF011_g10428 [Phytophthora fragariae]KAE9110583.1 hypothetical protein PF007_g11820 [Phytophthora fragariae]KAE9114956.1 hypothetical protein PF010_g9532 [Phytophthora fragariae]
MGRKAVKKLTKKAPKVIFEAATGKTLDVGTKIKPKRNKVKIKNKNSSYVVDDDAIKLMRRQLADVGCKLHEVEADGNCLFRALGDQLYGDQHRHEEVRGKLVDYLEQHRDDFEPFMEDEEKFDRYCERMRDDGTWGGNQELYAAARLFQVYVVVHQDQPSARIMVIECDRLKPTRFVHVAYHGEDHYDSVRALRDPIEPERLPVSIELSCEGFRSEDLTKRRQTHASPGPGTAAGQHQPEQRVVPRPADGEVDQLAGTLGEQLQLVARKTLSKRAAPTEKGREELRSTMDEIIDCLLCGQNE